LKITAYPIVAHRKDTIKDIRERGKDIPEEDFAFITSD